MVGPTPSRSKVGQEVIKEMVIFSGLDRCGNDVFNN